MDLSRRDFMVGGLVSLSGLPSDIRPQLEAQDTDDYAYQGAAFLLGPKDAKPDVDDRFWDNKVAGAFIYEDFEGTRHWATVEDKPWTPINWTNNVFVHSSDDLPEPTNGTHTLENKTYWFVGFVTSQYGLDISNSPALIGRHGSLDGFIHTGQNTAITGTDGGLFIRNLYVHSPGGTIFDLTADTTTEMLVQSSAFSDAAGIGEIASLGRITGYRVPTFKGCNFGQFQSGLVFDGSPNKIFVEGSPVRNISASNVTIFTGAPTLDVDVIDIASNYVKDVQSDTVVWYVDPSATISDVFQYRGNTHGTSVTESNVLTGQIGIRNVGTVVSDAYPLRDSDVSGTLTISDTYTILDGGPGIVNGNTMTYDLERISEPQSGVLRYDGRRDNQTRITANLSISAANTTVGARLLLNGTALPRTETTIDSQGTGARDNLTVIGGSVLLETGDTFAVELEDLDGTADITVSRLNFSV